MQTAIPFFTLLYFTYLQGSYWQVGDIVAATDADDGQKYYAQLRGFLEDQWYQKSVIITWLIPRPCGRNSQEGFDPSLYIAGSVVVLFSLIVAV